MSILKTLDKNGKWFRSKAVFPMVNPGNLQRFEPGEDVKATPDAWTEAQTRAGVLVELVSDGDGGFVEKVVQAAKQAAEQVATETKPEQAPAPETSPAPAAPPTPFPPSK